MARTTDAAVRVILNEANAVVAAHIETAAALVDEVCVPSGYTNERLELIERWLSAHFFTITAPRAASESAGPVSTSYLASVGKYLSGSTFGQQALALDTAGGLAALSKAAETGKQPETLTDKTRKPAKAFFVGRRNRG